jgi:sugar transferase (PEP-CTERM/EpsH1 system associated)
MKILFLAHRTPYPPDKGDKIRSFHVLSQLAKRHTVSLAYWVDDPKDLNHADALRRICRGTVAPVSLDLLRAKARAIWSLSKGQSFSAGYYNSSRFQRVVDTLVNEDRPDLFYVFSSAMAHYLERFEKTPAIVDFVDVDSEKWRQLSEFASFPFSRIYRLEHERLAQVEIEISRWARCSLFVSEVEAGLFREIGGKGRIVAVPNGVTFDLLRLPAHAELKPDNKRSIQKSSRSIHILFVGTMSYFPNADAVLYFAREIFPQIRSIFPQAVFDIVGRLPPRSVRRLSATNGICVHGEVDEIQPFLVQADVSIAPMRISRGVPNKILEAMAVGVPVVATTEAVKGIRVSDEQELLLGDTAERFAAQVIRLLSDVELRTRITKRARQRVQEVYNWRTIGNQLADLIEGTRPEVSFGVA